MVIYAFEPNLFKEIFIWAGRLNPAAGLYDIDYHDPHTSPPGSPPSNTRLYDIDYHDPHTSPPGGPPANAKANPRVSSHCYLLNRLLYIDIYK